MPLAARRHMQMHGRVQNQAMSQRSAKTAPRPLETQTAAANTCKQQATCKKHRPASNAVVRERESKSGSEREAEMRQRYYGRVE